MSTNTTYRGDAAIQFASETRASWIRVRDPQHPLGFRFVRLADAVRWPTRDDVTAGLRRPRRTEAQRRRDWHTATAARVPELASMPARACYACGDPSIAGLPKLGPACAAHVKAWADETARRDEERLDALEGRR